VAGGDFIGAGQFLFMSCDLPILRRDRLVDRGDRRIEHPCFKGSDSGHFADDGDQAQDAVNKTIFNNI